MLKTYLKRHVSREVVPYSGSAISVGTKDAKQGRKKSIRRTWYKIKTEPDTYVQVIVLLH